MHLIELRSLQKCFLRSLILFVIFNIDDSDSSLLIFSSRTNPKLHISLNLKMAKKVITALDSSLSKASCADFIPVAFQSNCACDLSRTQTAFVGMRSKDLFSRFLQSFVYSSCVFNLLGANPTKGLKS